MRQHSGGAKRQAWDTIKAEAPDVAEFLHAVNAAFGKPAAVRIVIAGNVVIEQGVLLPERRSRLPAMRPAKPFSGWGRS